MLLLLVALACTPPPEGADSPRETDESGLPDHTSAPDDTGETAPPEARLDLTPPAASTFGHFSTAETCADCHSAVDGQPELRDAAGRAIGQYDLWQGSMMANAARDPFWWASVALEIDPWPRTADAIEQVCVRCHAPALATEARFTGAALPTLEALRGDDDAARVGLDGVTCTVCHQIADEGLGEDAVDGLLPFTGEAVAWGPHATPRADEMALATGYTPAEGPHLLDAGLCATCHSVTTDVLNGLGDPSGRHFTEQAPYTEWSASAFAPTGATPRSCQDCHAPPLDEDGLPIVTAIAVSPDATPLPERAPFGRHVFFGGNTVVTALLRDNAAELNPLAPPEVLDVAVAGNRAFLRSAARLEVGAATRDGDTLAVPLSVVNLTGHKLPTGFPSRRMWLDLTVTDAAGVVVFRSGATDELGRLVDPAGAVLPEEIAFGPVHPHRDTLAPGEVQVWEHMLRDDERLPTIYLLLALGSAKDDRILPAGWADPPSEVNPVGVSGDATFLAGSDTVTLHIPAPVAGGPYRLSAALRFQTIGARHEAELYEVDAEAIHALRRMLDQSDRTPEILAEIVAELPEPVAVRARTR